MNGMFTSKTLFALYCSDKQVMSPAINWAWISGYSNKRSNFHYDVWLIVLSLHMKKITFEKDKFNDAYYDLIELTLYNMIESAIF